MPVTLTATFQRQTERAILVTIDNADHWLPKSQMESQDWDSLSRGEEVDICVSDWIAREKRLSAPADVNEDKFTVRPYQSADGATRYKVLENGVQMCACQTEQQANMIAAALALTEGKV